MDLPGRLHEAVTIPPGLTKAEALEYLAPYLGGVAPDETIVCVFYAYKLNGQTEAFLEDGFEELDVPLAFEKLDLNIEELEDTMESTD